MAVKFTFQSAFGNSRRNPRHFSARGREESLEMYSFFDLIGQHQNKRFYVTEIVLPLGFADAIFPGGARTTIAKHHGRYSKSDHLYQDGVE